MMIQEKREREFGVNRTLIPVLPVFASSLCFFISLFVFVVVLHLYFSNQQNITEKRQEKR